MKRSIIFTGTICFLAAITTPTHADPLHDPTPIIDAVIAQPGGPAALVSLSDEPDALVGPSNVDSLVFTAFVKIVDVPSGSLDATIYLNQIAMVHSIQSLIPPLTSDGIVAYMLGFALQNCCYQEQPGQIVVDVTGFETQTYDFRLLQPVPEPATMTLVTLGGLGIVARAWRRRRNPRGARLAS